MNRLKLLAALLLAGVWSLPGAAADAPLVTIETGALQGARDGGIDRFLGIPYAAPPVGELRWRVPQPAAGWEGIRAADAHGHACPKPLADPATGV